MSQEDIRQQEIENEIRKEDYQNERIKAKERYQAEFRELGDQFRQDNPHIQSTMHINELAALCYAIADGSGWHESTREFGTLMMLVVTEIAEAFEAWRDPDHEITDIWFIEDENGFQKPEGVGPELADAIIRILDHATIYGIEIKRPLELKLKYNMNRSYRHGGKRA